MENLIIGILCFCIGFVTNRLIFKKRAAGSLQIMESDEDGGPYLFLELEESVESVSNQKRVTLNVKHVSPHQ